MNRRHAMTPSKRAAILAAADAVALPRCVYQAGAPGKTEPMRLHPTTPEPGTAMDVPEMLPLAPDDPADWGEGAP